MKIEFFGGPYDGNYVEGKDAERHSPFNVGDALLFSGGHAYGWVGENGGTHSFRFIKTLSESERSVMRVCEFNQEANVK